MLETIKHNESGQAVITDLYAWMDGGTVSVKLASVTGEDTQVEFTQKASLENKHGQFPAGSLVLNNCVVEIRSDLERMILQTVKNATFSEQVSLADRQFKECLDEAIQFVESEDYIHIARKIGRTS